MKTTLLIATLALLANTSFAAEKKAHPCKAVMDACKSAGFSKKDMREKCIKPVVEGSKVEGVTVDDASIAACKKVAEKRKAKRAEVQSEAKEKRLEGKDTNE